MLHQTVLRKEAVEGLALKEDSVVFDCTFGAGGHAAEILTYLGKAGTYVGIDADATAFLDAKLPQTQAFVQLVERNFKEIAAIADELRLSPTAILADLGWRSDQFADGGKGFSFVSDDPLLMTFGEPSSYTFTAHTIVNDWEEESIADIIYGYGEERGSRVIARAIVAKRAEVPIETARELADIVASALPASRGRGKLHPATKTFQALRIAVNDELGALKTLLSDGFEILSPGGRMAIISFHSLEDRIVKRFFKEKVHDQSGRLIHKKPLTPSDEEMKENPRSRSAKLRIIEKNEI